MIIGLLKKSGLLIIESLLLLALTTSCSSNHKKTSFESWYKQFEKTNSIECQESLNIEVFQSTDLNISGIAKSMSGDMSQQIVDINFWNEKLIWVKGCDLEIVNTETDMPVSKEYLCHNIINYHKPEELPWSILTRGTDKRIFTLSQGINKIEFPKGFALPMPVPAKFSIGNQVLNLNDSSLKTELKFNVGISYIKDSEICERPKALFQQAIYITKKVSGPAGGYNQKDSVFTDTKINMDTAFAQCAISYDEGFNPYLDPFGRQFTSHWIVSTDSIEVLKTNVTPMMNLDYDTRIHYIAVHVHPHAHSLELFDRTAQKSLFKAYVTNFSSLRKGIKTVDTYSSEKGLAVYTDHEYEMISTYLNPDGETDISAMATMFLYMAEKKGSH